MSFPHALSFFELMPVYYTSTYWCVSHVAHHTWCKDTLAAYNIHMLRPNVPPAMHTSQDNLHPRTVRVQALAIVT